MATETLKRLRERVKELEANHPQWSEETSKLIDHLQKEIQTLEASHRDEAATIANFTSSSVHEVARVNPSPELKELSLSGLQKSILGFETSHPELVRVINDICTRLSQMGI